jgi:hypothetical protein
MTEAAGRRDNGLSARSYERLLEVEAHLVDGLLDRLRDEQVAAYTAPAPGRRGPYGDTVLPAVPSAGVWVDSARSADARAVVDRYLEDVATEVAWAGIVADLESDRTDPAPGWPDRPAEEPRRPAPPRTVDPDEHFRPPPPPPLPSIDPVTRLAWGATLGGPATLLLAAIAGIPLSGWVGLLAVLAFVAGFVTLVARMKPRPPTDSGPDDGAVV